MLVIILHSNANVCAHTNTPFTTQFSGKPGLVSQYPLDYLTILQTRYPSCPNQQRQNTEALRGVCVYVCVSAQNLTNYSAQHDKFIPLVTDLLLLCYHNPIQNKHSINLPSSPHRVTHRSQNPNACLPHCLSLPKNFTKIHQYLFVFSCEQTHKLLQPPRWK